MDEKILEILSCPLCKGRLMYDSKAQELICRLDKLAYPIKDNIPVMIPEQARRIGEENN